jgi:hypothetical protein
VARRTKGEWQSLIVEHQKSGLTAAAFCRSKGLNAKYFSLRKKQFSEPDTPAFVSVQVSDATAGAISVDWKNTHITLPVTLPSLWVANFIKQLSA